MIPKDLLEEIRDRLAKAYGTHFRGVVLYGSVARGDDRPDSDIDVMVLLDKPATTWQEIRTAAEALLPLMLEIDRVVDAVPIDVKLYEEGAAPLYANAKREGIMA